MSTRTFVIVGAGLAGAKAAQALREQGFDGNVVLVGDERHHPYERPPLSKDYLSGKADNASVFVHPADWYADQSIELRTGVAATSIDRAAHQVELADGSRIGYDKLLLTTGSSPRTLPGVEGVHYLRKLEDSDRIKKVLATGGHLVTIGAGWIGLEVAAAAREAGLRVTVLEALDLPLLRVLGPRIAQVFADLHTEHGVDLRLGVTVEEIDADHDGQAHVRLADGTVFDADAVLVGIGAVPNTQLAQDAGLEVRDGVVVDVGMRTSDPDIFAAGDVANAHYPLLARHLRVEHWANALNQPATAAASMLGQEARYDELPYFFTDQYDLGMEYLGHSEGADQVVVRGDLGTREFIAFWLRDRRVLAAMNVNVWDVTDPIKALIRSGQQVDPDALADLGTALPG